MHTGEALRSGHDYRGRPVNRAARIAGCAHGGQVLVSETTAGLLRAGRGGVELLDLGVHHLRDLSEPERLWQLAAPDLGREFPPIRVPSMGADTSLPDRRSSLVGRDRDVETTAALVSTHAMVTLVGVGGVGKTRVAIAAAASLRPSFDAIHFVDLSPIEGPSGAAELVAAAIPPASSDASTLFVIDNCEHLRSAVASTLDRLLARPGVHVLATSRERLEVEGERIVRVSPLSTESEAVELFRTRAADAGVELSGDDSVVRDICRRVDGIPLAIELAAARVPTLGLTGLRAALDGRLVVLSSSRRGPGRHQTMARTIDWSTRLLGADERRLLEWLAVFSGGFELDAAAHVAAAIGIEADRALDLVESLVAQSLLEVDHHRVGARYRMLRLVRSHALDALDQRGERRSAAACHADWVATLCGLPMSELCSARVERHAVRLEREADNWRQAMSWATSTGEGGLDGPDRSELIARLCGPPTVYFLLGRHELADVAARLPELCDRPDHLHAALSAAASSSAGVGHAATLRAMSDQIRLLEPERPTGMATLIDWIACVWTGEAAAGVDTCLQAADDPRLPQDTRDLFLGIATTDRFSLTEDAGRRAELAERCLAVSAATGVRTHRAACLLGAAWAILPMDPDRATELVGLALDEVPFLPSYVRQTLPGNASRLLATVDLERAASGLAQQIETIDLEAATFAELIPVVYATALLDSVGHPSAEPALEALRSSPVATYVEMVGLGPADRRHESATRPSELAGVVDDLHAALTRAEVR